MSNQKELAMQSPLKQPRVSGVQTTRLQFTDIFITTCIINLEQVQVLCLHLLQKGVITTQEAPTSYHHYSQKSRRRHCNPVASRS